MPQQHDQTDITGQRFGKLVGVETAGSRRGRTHWLFNCDCGETVCKSLSHVKLGTVKSCGCGKSKSNAINLNSGRLKQCTDEQLMAEVKRRGLSA